MMQALFNTVFNLRMFSIVRRLYCLSCEPPEIHIVRVLFNGLFNLAHVQHRQESLIYFHANQPESLSYGCASILC